MNICNDFKYLGVPLGTLGHKDMSSSMFNYIEDF